MPPLFEDILLVSICIVFVFCYLGLLSSQHDTGTGDIIASLTSRDARGYHSNAYSRKSIVSFLFPFSVSYGVREIHARTSLNCIVPMFIINS